MSSTPFKGRVRPGRATPGASFVTVSHRPLSEVGGHEHDWPNLTIHLAGACVESFEGHSTQLDGPGAVFHPARSGHADKVLASGLETAGLMFDPEWLGSFGRHSLFDRPHVWRGGRTALAGRHLVSAWRSSSTTDAVLRQVTDRFFSVAEAHDPAEPAWLPDVTAILSREHCPGTTVIAQQLGLHPAWLARRYREATGEGLHETLRRKRVECALGVLRASDAPLAQIAAEAGFYDQPHMNRCFRQVLGTTPVAYRAGGDLH